MKKHEWIILIGGLLLVADLPIIGVLMMGYVMPLDPIIILILGSITLVNAVIGLGMMFGGVMHEGMNI